MSLRTTYDVVIVGGGHNGLVAASYLAKAGKSVLVLERNDYIGGATTSSQVFPDFEARLSRYAYLVSLFPQKIIQDLGLSVEFRRRRTASFTPFDGNQGLLLSNIDEAHNQRHIERLHAGDYAGYQRLQAMNQHFAEKTWESFLHPLQSKGFWQKQFQTDEEKAVWRALVEEPIGLAVEQHLQSDLLRGVVLTDAKIGSYTHAHDESLLQNRTYLYHVVGNKTGEWRVPVGGMGALVQALENTATHHNATLWTEANVTQLHLGQEWHNVGFEKNGQQYEVKTRYVLVNASPITLKKLLNEPFLPTDQDEGTAFKVNMLLRRLPRLKADVSPQEAFAGTFHIHQSYSQLQRAFDEAANGQIPSLPPCEIYCHTLTDDSILSPALAQQGYHTLTLFGLDMPYRLFVEKPDATKKQVLAAYLAGINMFLAEPLEDCLARARDGSFCIEAKSAWDLEQEVGLPRGNIFHKELSWFFAEDAPSVGQRGVETSHPRLYVCGSSAQRGGAVSGIPGYNAAMKVLATT